ncbi:MAG: LuxR family transcriptional regulator [Ignavibacteriae bacterium]|nr:LuxR family transcriptional regulator [Ignavibacteriota bacterium]
MKIVDEITLKLENAWEKLGSSPKLDLEQALNILQEVRLLKIKSTTQSSSAFISLELRTLHLLAHTYFIINDFKNAREIADELLLLSNQEESIEYSALAEHVLAKLETSEAKYEQAISRLTGILPSLEKVGNYLYVQAVLIDLSNICLYQNRYDESIGYLLGAEAEYLAHPTTPRVSKIIMSGIANVYYRLGNYDKAEEYSLRNANEFKVNNDILGYSNALLQLSELYSERGDFTKQINTLKEGIDILSGHDFYLQIAIMIGSLGSAYFDVGDFKNALFQFQSALSTLEQEKDIKNIAILHQRIGILYSHPDFEQRNSETAQSYFKQAEQTAIELSMPHFQAAALESWSESCVSFGLFEDGYALLQRSTALEKQILNEKSLQQLRDLEVQYDVALKQKDNELLAANNKALELERNHLESQLSTNNKSLLIQMNELNTFRSDVIGIIAQLDKQDEIGKKLKTKVRESHLMQGTWTSYLQTFSKVHPDFQATLTSKYRNLTRMEVKICILIKAGLTSEEIAQILSLSARTIENNRLRIRKKLNLGERESLSKYLIEL